jgi:hypothetical protein
MTRALTRHEQNHKHSNDEREKNKRKHARRQTSLSNAAVNITACGLELLTAGVSM